MDVDEIVIDVSVSFPDDVIEIIEFFCAVVMEIVNDFIVIDPELELRNAVEREVPILKVTVPDEERVSDFVLIDNALVSLVCVPAKRVILIDV